MRRAGSIISHVQSRLVSARPIDRRGAVLALNSAMIHRTDRTSVAADGQLPIGGCSNPSLGGRRDSADRGHAVIEFHSRNHVRILPRGNSSASPPLFFPPPPPPFHPSRFPDAEFLPSFSTGIPGTPGSMARSRAPLFARSFIGVRKFDPPVFFSCFSSPPPLFFLSASRSGLVRIPGPKPQPLRGPEFIGRGTL